MMPFDRLAHAAGAAVDHEPEPILFIGLQFDEMISAAERAELESADIAQHGRQPIVRQRVGFQLCR